LNKRVAIPLMAMFSFDVFLFERIITDIADSLVAMVWCREAPTVNGSGSAWGCSASRQAPKVVSLMHFHSLCFRFKLLQ